MTVRDRLVLGLLLVLAGAVGCAPVDASGEGVAFGEVQLTLRADVEAPATEVYECFSFDASALEGKFLRGLRWTTEEGAVVLHHAGVYSAPGEPFEGAIPCEALPAGAGGIHIWAPGSSAMSLPEGIAIVLPPGTRSIVVQAHAVRLREGRAGLSTLTLETTTEPPAHVATWLRADAKVPTIEPHARTTSTGACVATGELHVLSTRPHMHKIGREFHASVLRADGGREAFADVDDWVWHDQSTFDEDVALAKGDAIETTCVWENTTDAEVKEGLKVTDEMCQQGMIVWPAANARWSACP